MSSYEFKTVVGENLEVKVCFDYQPAEPAIYPQGEYGYPGCNAEIQNMSVMAGKLEWGGFDISEDLSRKCISRLESECFDQVEKEAREQ